jgi:mono/diheme cytochrome c family protein
MKCILVKFLVFLVIVILSAVFFINFKFNAIASQKYEGPQFTIDDEVASSDVELGKRIYEVRSGCKDCHGENLAGAKIMDNPALGTFYGANISIFV